MPPQITRGVFVKNVSSQQRRLPDYKYVCSRYIALEWYKSHVSSSRQFRGPSTLNIHPTSARFSSNVETPRAQLIRALKDLNKNASPYVSQSRLQLALRGLEQKSREETIRIAVLCITGEKSSFQRAKRIIQLLLADPLKPQELWEQILLSECSQTILLKFDPETCLGTLKENNLVQELYVSSPLLNGSRAEILIMESNLPSNNWEKEFSLEAFLVPSVKIPSSGTARYNIIRTPVHRTLLISEGLIGAINVLKIPMNFNCQDTLGAAIDLNVSNDYKTSIPYKFLNVALATEALESFRQKGIKFPEYEKNWSLSGLPKIQSWLQQSIISTNIEMKLYLQKLIESLLENTSRAIRDEQARLLTEELSRKVSQNDITKLREELQNWASQSHCELQDNLELVFNGQRWRKLSWWKLFWRVDDISLIASEILNEHFLTNSEQEAIFLAGRIEERGISDIRKGQVLTPSELYAPKNKDEGLSKARVGYEPAPPQLRDFISNHGDNLILQKKKQIWPPHISIARVYLSRLTIPSLQAIGQRLVIQTLCTSSLSILLSGLMLISSVSMGLYEVGVMAAIGILLSLRRMQKKWEKAREKWEDEVREEGRTALRSVEAIFNAFLTKKSSIPEFEEIKQAKAAILAVEEALLACNLK